MSQVFPDTKLYIHTLRYIPHPSKNISPEWIATKIEEDGRKGKVIAQEMNMHASTLSAHQTGTKPLSDRTKALYYYYFRCKELEQFIEANELEVPSEKRERQEIERKK